MTATHFNTTPAPASAQVLPTPFKVRRRRDRYQIIDRRNGQVVFHHPERRKLELIADALNLKGVEPCNCH